MNLGEAQLQITYEDGVFSTDHPNYPMVEVSWYGAVAYCDWLSVHRGLNRSYNHSNWLCNGFDPYNAPGYRLPTEAEWEYACRAGSNEAYANTDIGTIGDDCFITDPELLDAICWYGINSGSVTNEVGNRIPNAWNLFDMHGNVVEWCNDRYRAKYCGVTCPDTNPVGPSMGDTRVQRGGHFFSYFDRCRSGARAESEPANASNVAGFRVVITE